MDHNSLRHKLSEYIDGTISPEERSLIEEHLKTCGKCSDALRELRKTVEHIRTVEEIEPPVWMTQKIMAKVRVEAEQQKSFSERLYLMFVVKLPIKAVAVVFLAAIAFYLYRDIQPQKRFETTPGEITARQQASPAPGAKDERSKPGPSSPRAKQVPQSPEYKALDMKGEYEKPAPPILADKMAPSPAKQEELTGLAKKEPAMERRAFAPQASAPATAENQAASGAGAFARSEKKSTGGLDEGTPVMGFAANEEPQSRRLSPTAKAKKARPDESGASAAEIIMKVKDLDSARKEIETAATAFGGKAVSTATPADKSTMIVSINADKFDELLLKLKTIGEVKEKVPAPAGREGYLTIKITMTNN